MPNDKEGHSGLQKMVDRAQDMVGAAVGMASASSAGATNAQMFVTNAAISDLYEIEAGRMAQQRAMSPELRRLAETLVLDHEKSLASLRSTVASLDRPVTLPTELDERRKGMLDNLTNATDDDFEAVFQRQQVTAHEEALTLHKGYAAEGDDVVLRGLASAMVPVLDQHLSMAQGRSPSEMDAAGR